MNNKLTCPMCGEDVIKSENDGYTTFTCGSFECLFVITYDNSIGDPLKRFTTLIMTNKGYACTDCREVSQRAEGFKHRKICIQTIAEEIRKG